MNKLDQDQIEKLREEYLEKYSNSDLVVILDVLCYSPDIDFEKELIPAECEEPTKFEIRINRQDIVFHFDKNGKLTWIGNTRKRNKNV